MHGCELRKSIEWFLLREAASGSRRVVEFWVVCRRWSKSAPNHSRLPTSLGELGTLLCCYTTYLHNHSFPVLQRAPRVPLKGNLGTTRETTRREVQQLLWRVSEDKRTMILHCEERGWVFAHHLPTTVSLLATYRRTRPRQRFLRNSRKSRQTWSMWSCISRLTRKERTMGFLSWSLSPHKAAALARRRLMSGRVTLWGNIVPTADWAEPQEEPDEETMSKVRNLSTIWLTLLFSFLIFCMYPGLYICHTTLGDCT